MTQRKIVVVKDNLKNITLFNIQIAAHNKLLQINKVANNLKLKHFEMQCEHHLLPQTKNLYKRIKKYRRRKGMVVGSKNFITSSKMLLSRQLNHKRAGIGFKLPGTAPALIEPVTLTFQKVLHRINKIAVFQQRV